MKEKKKIEEEYKYGEELAKYCIFLMLLGLSLVGLMGTFDLLH